MSARSANYRNSVCVLFFSIVPPPGRALISLATALAVLYAMQVVEGVDIPLCCTKCPTPTTASFLQTLSLYIPKVVPRKKNGISSSLTVHIIIQIAVFYHCSARCKKPNSNGSKWTFRSLCEVETYSRS